MCHKCHPWRCAMTQSSLAPHVFAHLQREGHVTADRVTKRPVVRTCRHCAASVIAAIEDEPAGRMRVELEPAHLTPVGELQAALVGIATFEVTPTAIWWRDPSRIAGKPANATNVMAEHKCHSPPLQSGPPPIGQTNPSQPPATNSPPF